MLLRRIGNKKKIAEKIIKHFPPHKVFIEPFFGAGGMFFNKPKVKYNIVNDLDSDVFNLFQVIMNQKEEFEKALYITPVHSDLLKYWKKNKETEPIKKALRFIFLSNLLNPITGDIKRNTQDNSKKISIQNLKLTEEFLSEINIKFFNEDFKIFIERIYFEKSRPNQKKDSFIYCDFPYVDTKNGYNTKKWTQQNSLDLFDCLKKTGCKFAMSEFDNSFILNQAKQRNLNVITIGERRNFKNRKIEILITNYQNNLKLF